MVVRGWFAYGLAALCTSCALQVVQGIPRDATVPDAMDGGPAGTDANRPEVSEGGATDGSLGDAGDGATRCGNGMRDPGEACDDGNRNAGDGCSADCSSDETCGNGVVDTAVGESCDDGNRTAGDGCENGCGFTCTTDADCADRDVCNGTEQCSMGGTLASRCVAATAPAVDGTACGSGLLCVRGVCGMATCGDGYANTAAGEQCDDGNRIAGDGCENGCTFTCSGNAECADSETCNGIETCTSPATAASRCVAGTALSDGTACATGKICVAGACRVPSCGDGVTSAPEQCDDGNARDGDGCDADCTFTCGNDTACSDGDPCNGVETCTTPGTVMSRCNPAAMAAADGTPCPGGKLCVRGACSTSVCGDGFTDPARAEQCDDRNMVAGDGCENDCTFTCANDMACSDGEPCNGTESCSNPGTATSRCQAGTPPAMGTACGTGRVCNAGVCRAAGCGDRIVTAPEQCDDGNTVNGDGCRNDCTFTCSAAADCSDGNTCNGAETCTSPGTTLSRCGAGTTPANGTSCGTGRICVTGTCVAARCGDRIVTAPEQCDDGNFTNGDGCRNDCTFTCSDAARCSDGNACNGAEVCNNAGTTMSRCAAGTPPTNGTSCGTGRICVTGACVTARCGDGIVTAPELCDDGNANNADGCRNDCTWTCTSAAPCDDGNPCNGAETCTSPSSTASRCATGTAPSTGTPCDRDANPATRDVCRVGMCLASICGDSFTDTGATPPEQCDDGNMASNDGCSATCQTEAVTVVPTAFRATAFRLISPRIVANVPLGGCQDLTDGCARVFGACVADSVNTQFSNALLAMASGGTYSLHVLDVFRPLNPMSATSAMDLHMNGACMESPNPDACGPDPTMPSITSSTADNQTAGTCYAPVSADVNGRRGTTTVTYTPGANTVSGPCYSSRETTITVTISGIAIPLQHARVAATYGGSPVSQLTSGLIVGFLPERVAADTLLPTTLPAPLGGSPLYSVLQAAGATTTNSSGRSIGSSCNLSGGTAEDDRDTLADGTRGFWFFLNFTAEKITWTGS